METILYEQATRLAARGYPVTVFSGRGGPLPDGSLELRLIPLLDSRHPEVTAVRERLLKGEVPATFDALSRDIQQELTGSLAGIDILIVHNALSLHFNLPLTAALWKIADQARPRLISWIHDLSWANPLYQPLMQDREPWDLLRRANRRITPIFVSKQRLDEWNKLSGQSLDESHVIPNGIDAAALLRLGPPAQEIASRFQLLQTDVVMLAPVRITRRKNLEWAIEAAAGVRKAGYSVQLLISGPPGPHDPHSMGYVEELKELTRRLDLQAQVQFLYEQSSQGAAAYAVDAATLSDLYMLSDVVVLPSASEGFGLPLAEAGILRTPVVCTDLPAFHEVAPTGVRRVAVGDGSASFTAAVLETIDLPAARLRRHLLNAFSWDRLISQRLEPLLAAT